MKTLTYTAKLSRSTHENLDTFLEQQRLLWNVALEQRKVAYKRCGKSLTAYDQYKDLTTLRKEPQYRKYHVACQRSVSD